jgi:Rifampin ADP-ribosyl transferase
MNVVIREVHDEMSWQRYYIGTRSDLTPEDRFYHGTRADLQEGDLVCAGHSANFGVADRLANHVYFSATLDAAMWGAELARGATRGRVYIVEPTGQFSDDPNLTDQRFPGNPTKSYRSREPLRIIGEVVEWQGHSLDALQAMKDHIARLDLLGTNNIDD